MRFLLFASYLPSVLGKLEDVRPAISDCCVYVLPSYREGTPRTVLEAMAMGRPIITTDAPGCRETGINGKNGFLVLIKSIDALVEAMLKFIKNPALCIHMGKKSRLLAEEKYYVHKVNTITKDIVYDHYNNKFNPFVSYRQLLSKYY